MRKVIPLLALTLYLLSAMTISRSVSADNEATPDPKTLFQPEALAIKDQEFLTVYGDGYTILSTNNNCSRFFGGTTEVLEVFNQMLANFRKGVLDVSTGIQMSGTYSNYRNTATGFAYRLFEKQTVNMRGSFYSQKRFPSESQVPEIGHFAPNTRGARVLMLLHELAHLIKGQDGHWLIPDDGFNLFQSRNNTALIEKQCGEEIRKLE